MRIKRMCLVFLSLCLLVATTGCNRTYDYSFAQSLDKVEKVEIRTYDDATQSSMLVVTLNETDGKALLSEVNALKCKRYFGDCPRSYGEVIIYITYLDQTAEVIGIDNVAQVDKNGKWHIGIEHFDRQQLCTLILKYVDKDLLPDLSKYLD